MFLNQTIVLIRKGEGGYVLLGRSILVGAAGLQKLLYLVILLAILYPPVLIHEGIACNLKLDSFGISFYIYVLKLSRGNSCCLHSSHLLLLFCNECSLE